MQWTREERYRLLDDVDEQELIELKRRVDDSPYRLHYHIQPPTGLLNDPNGFAYYNGEYHLFYQWFPLGPVHGLKHWYHLTSTDLVQWEENGVGIAPTHYYDSHGAFSGTAMEHDNKLYLMYTGNTRDQEWNRSSYQAVAVMEAGEITKSDHPVISELPSGYTSHFRDPKLWKEGGMFYALIGAQRTNQTGCVLLYQSSDLQTWTFGGEVTVQQELNSFGFMWECPDYLTVDGEHVFMFCPQGIEADGMHYQNLYQSGYMLIDQIDVEQPALSSTAFHEFDRGFDFYAPQTTTDEFGNKILIGWMGLPEIEYPSDQDGWAHCMTIPRELRIECGKLKQMPVTAITKRRQTSRHVTDDLLNGQQSYDGFSGVSYELECNLRAKTAKRMGILVRTGVGEQTKLLFDLETNVFTLDRSIAGKPFAIDYGTTRSCSLHGSSMDLRVFVDTSSIEVFVNGGEEVFTARIFPDQKSDGIVFFTEGGEAKLEASFYRYHS